MKLDLHEYHSFTITSIPQYYIAYTLVAEDINGLTALYSKLVRIPIIGG